ncbi:hypothetical protein V500_11024 [Pseudogymnoascus sp. VKM F-4518 (FW-2643)]|nr:hypothetical protein V500_11024 [Pseudogymnoascus sp. VKM F-4518 (FW-2643)]
MGGDSSAFAADVKVEVDAAIDGLNQRLQEVNRKIWENPELGEHEFMAHETLCSFLEEQGYAVTRSAYGRPTAFEVLSGSGGRLVNFNAEYDCLPGIGHACGHNLIATSSVAAFLGLSISLKKLGVPGRVQLLGTPDEEGSGAKIKLLEAGAYKGVDASLMAHPIAGDMAGSGQGNEVNDGVAGIRMIARQYLSAEYRGKNAHAGGNPWKGVNALDSAISAYNNISLLRQQMEPDERIHNVLLESEKTVNVIPAYAKAAYQARSPRLAGLKVLTARVVNCINAAALATGTEVKIEYGALYADVVLNETICGLYTSHIARYGQQVTKISPIIVTGSTDQGNVSQVMPALHTMFSIPTEGGVGPHNAGFAKAAGTDVAHDKAIIVGKTMAMVGFDILTKDDVYENVKADWEKAMAA